MFTEIFKMLQFVYNPQTPEDLIKFYFVWVMGLFLIHVVVDRYSSQTPKQKLSDLQNKVSEMYSAATVSSSLLLATIMLNGFKTHPLFASDAIFAPLVLSTISGLLVGLGGLSLKIPQPANND